MPTAVVTGANSGIGLAFAKLLLEEGYEVYAVDLNHTQGLESLSSSHPSHAHTSKLDVTSPSSIAELKSTIGNKPINLLLNIAGIAFPVDKDTLTTTTLTTFEKTFAVNSYGPMFVTQALLPNILAAAASSSSIPPRIGVLTSRVGSVGDNTTGGIYAYRASKAAANSVARSIAMDLKDKGVVVTVLHPGFVRSGLLPGNDGPEFVEPEEAARKLWRNVVSQKGIEETGRFWHREGFELPW